MRCPEHGVVVCAVPWARHDSRFTRAFEQQVAWLAVNTSGSAVAELTRIAWRSVGRICQRVAEEAGREVDLLAGLRRIGIDEISHRKGHRYLTVVVDHDTGRLIWAAPGRDKATVEAFFDALGEKRAKRLELVSCDMAGWIEAVLAKRCPKAKRCVDPFHVIQLATEALDKVRREVWNEARRQGQGDVAREPKGARYALWKNPENLTPRQQSKLTGVERLNRPLYRAYLLKEQLRQIYRLPARKAIALLGGWLSWARRCRLRALRQARPHDHRAARGDRRRDPPRPLQRTGGGDQHPDPPDRPPRLRLSLTSGADLPGDAEARRIVSAPPRPSHRYVTHGNVRRAPNWAYILSAHACIGPLSKSCAPGECGEECT